MKARCIKTAYPLNGKQRDEPLYVEGRVYAFRTVGLMHYADYLGCDYETVDEHGVPAVMSDDYFDEHFVVEEESE